MKRLLERIRAGEVILADGAMGTMLIAWGLKPGQCPEELNLTHPEVLEGISRSYLAAGAEMLQTNTFGASTLKLTGHRLADRMAEINRAGVEIVQRVAGGQAYVVACCGPSGRILAPYGDTDPAEVYQSFARQLEVLVSSGIDAVNFETMIDLAEAKLAVRAAKAQSPQLTVIATMTFESSRRGFFTVMGNRISEVADGLAEAGADVIGSNCGNGLDMMIAVAREFRKVSRLPISIRPNAGLPEVRDGKPYYSETPAFMAERLEQLLDVGVAIVAGCCGTTPEHIGAFRKTLDARRRSDGATDEHRELQVTS
jgi:5-methyltetrahydrofolate--homocysteine methyltransferase